MTAEATLDALVGRLLRKWSSPAARAALEAELDRIRLQAASFPVEAALRALCDFVATHRRVPERPALFFSDALYFIKSSPAVLAPGRVFVSDKEWVKAWVREAAGETFNVPTLAVLRTADEVRLFDFPRRCVVKPTHLSGEVVLRAAGEPLDRTRIASWLSCDYTSVSGELNYRRLEPKVVVEPFVFDETHVDDYKLFCVDGRVRVVQVDQDRATFHRRVLYDSDGRTLPFSIHYPRGEERPLPANFAAMKALAEQLAAPFGFIRVDLYSNGREVRVGELTNCHGGGLEGFGSFEQEVAVSRIVFGDTAAGEDGEAHPAAARRLSELAARHGLGPEATGHGGAGEDEAFLAFLSAQLSCRAATRVLWLGPPGRTQSLAAEVRSSGGRWLLVEDEAGRLAREWAAGPAFEGEQAVTPLVATDLLGMRPSFYDLSLLGSERFDVVVVEGPSSLSGPMARLPALPALVGNLSPSFTLLLCDADGRDERKALDIWRLLAPQLPVANQTFGRGVAVVGTLAPGARVGQRTPA